MKKYDKPKTIEKDVERSNCGRFIKDRFLCFCGNEFVTSRSSVKRGSTGSCGCLMKKINIRHGERSRGLASVEYTAWLNMKARCLTPKSTSYKNYGARGITICFSWIESFENFIRDMGRRPENTSLDRIDNEKGYYKENCRWADIITQANNKRNSKKNKVGAR